jgi:hypothetical protein
MAHEDHVLRRSVEIEDAMGLGIVVPSAFEREVVEGGGATLEGCQFDGREKAGQENEGTPFVGSVRSDDLKSEMSSLPGSEDEVVGTAEVIDVRLTRIPEELREKVREWIVELERVRDEDGDVDRESVCFHSYTARERRTRGERGRLGSDGEVEVDAEDRDGGSVYGGDGGSRVDGSGEVPVVPKKGEQ